MAGGQILAFPIDFDRRPYNTLALPCEYVMHVPQNVTLEISVYNMSFKKVDSVCDLGVRFDS